MISIELTMHVRAPVERVFDLSRSIELHVRSAGRTGERPVAGRTSGLIGMGETVTWRARHLGVWQQLTSRISAYDRPRHFQDVQVRGAFAWFEHDHFFEPDGQGGTVVREVFRLAAPLGPLGWVAERLVLRRHMTRFLRERGEVIRRVAESEDEWREFLSEG